MIQETRNLPTQKRCCKCPVLRQMEGLFLFLGEGRSVEDGQLPRSFPRARGRGSPWPADWTPPFAARSCKLGPHQAQSHSEGEWGLAQIAHPPRPRHALRHTGGVQDPTPAATKASVPAPMCVGGTAEEGKGQGIATRCGAGGGEENYTHLPPLTKGMDGPGIMEGGGRLGWEEMDGLHSSSLPYYTAT